MMRATSPTSRAPRGPSRPGVPRSGLATVPRRLTWFVAFLIPAALTHLSLAQQPAQTSSPAAGQASPLPSAPSPQVGTPTAPGASSGSLAGFIVDTDGDSIGGAQITLTRTGQPSPDNAAALSTTSTSDGRFTIPSVLPGSFKLSVAASGFASQQITGVLQPGEDRELPYIVLLSGSNTNIQVTASQQEIAQAQVQEEVKQHVLGFIPNFYVSYVPDPVPLSPRQKTELGLRTMIDPMSFVLNGVTAGVQQATNTFAWGQGAQGYGKRYAAAYGTLLTSTLIGNIALPIVFKQDPRYYYKGTGSVPKRAFYAIANAVVCKGDNHHWQLNYSGFLGALAASGIAEAYYPAVNRAGAGPVFEGTALGTGIAAVQNLIQEFIVRRLTPHIPPPVPANP
jgi:hypothetical protein